MSAVIHALYSLLGVVALAQLVSNLPSEHSSMPLICCGIGECNFTGATCYRNGGTQAVAIANG